MAARVTPGYFKGCNMQWVRSTTSQLVCGLAALHQSNRNWPASICHGQASSFNFSRLRLASFRSLQHSPVYSTTQDLSNFSTDFFLVPETAERYSIRSDDNDIRKSSVIWKFAVGGDSGAL